MQKPQRMYTNDYDIKRCQEAHFFGAFRYHPFISINDVPLDGELNPHFFGAFTYDPYSPELVDAESEEQPKTERHHATEQIIEDITRVVEKLTKKIAHNVSETDEPASFTIACKLEPGKKGGLPNFSIIPKTSLNEPTIVRPVRLFDDQMTFPFDE